MPGRLYALDVLPPSAPTATPTLQVAWWYDFEGPSGASPMVMPAGDTGGTAPVGDQIYFDGSGVSGQTQEDPSLFALQDDCLFGSLCCTPGPGATCLSSASTWEPVWSSNLDPIDFAMGLPTQYQESGKCPIPGSNNKTFYDGIQSAPVLEIPEVGGGSDPHYSVWEHVACGPYLYRFDAQTGALWTGNGVTNPLNIATITQLDGYVPGSTMQTVTDADPFMVGSTQRIDQVAFLGINHSPANTISYIIALDLYTGTVLWEVKGPTPLQNSDSPFHGQFPIAQTPDGSYLLIAPTAGSVDGSIIMGIPLK